MSKKTDPAAPALTLEQCKAYLQKNKDIALKKPAPLPANVQNLQAKKRGKVELDFSKRMQKQSPFEKSRLKKMEKDALTYKVMKLAPTSAVPAAGATSIKNASSVVGSGLDSKSGATKKSKELAGDVVAKEPAKKATANPIPKATSNPIPKTTSNPVPKAPAISNKKTGTKQPLANLKSTKEEGASTQTESQPQQLTGKKRTISESGIPNTTSHKSNKLPKRDLLSTTKTTKLKAPGIDKVLESLGNSTQTKEHSKKTNITKPNKENPKAKGTKTNTTLAELDSLMTHEKTQLNSQNLLKAQNVTTPSLPLPTNISRAKSDFHAMENRRGIVKILDNLKSKDLDNTQEKLSGTTLEHPEGIQMRSIHEQPTTTPLSNEYQYQPVQSEHDHEEYDPEHNEVAEYQLTEHFLENDEEQGNQNQDHPELQIGNVESETMPEDHLDAALPTDHLDTAPPVEEYDPLLPGMHGSLNETVANEDHYGFQDTKPQQYLWNYPQNTAPLVTDINAALAYTYSRPRGLPSYNRSNLTQNIPNPTTNPPLWEQYDPEMPGIPHTLFGNGTQYSNQQIEENTKSPYLQIKQLLSQLNPR